MRKAIACFLCNVLTFVVRYSFGPDGMVASDADVHAFYTSLLQYRMNSRAQFTDSLGHSAALPVLTALKQTPSHDFIIQPPKSSPPYHRDDSILASAACLLHSTNYDAPSKDLSPFAAFATEHYFVSILATQVVGASLRLQHGIATQATPRHVFIHSDLTVSSLRCLAFLASNIKLPHIFLRHDTASSSSSGGVAACLRGFDLPSHSAASGPLFADSPQTRLQKFDTWRSSLAGDLSPVELFNMLCDEQTPYVMTSLDLISSSDSGSNSVKRCAFGRMLLMEPFLSNAVSFILHNSSAIQQLPRFALVSSHAILGTRVELGRCSGNISASFPWDGPSVADGGVKHHPSVFCFASHNSVDCALLCLSLLVSAAEMGHGWFTHSEGGGCQFYSARGCILAFSSPLPCAAHFLQDFQQPATSSFSDALHLSLQMSLSRGRPFATDSTSQLLDQPQTPQTPRSKRDVTSDALPCSPSFLPNLRAESIALVLSQYVDLQSYDRRRLTATQVHFAPLLLDRGQGVAGKWRRAALFFWLHC
jgi:hypothetical protein